MFPLHIVKGNASKLSMTQKYSFHSQKAQTHQKINGTLNTVTLDMTRSAVEFI